MQKFILGISNWTPSTGSHIKLFKVVGTGKTSNILKLVPLLRKSQPNTICINLTPCKLNIFEIAFYFILCFIRGGVHIGIATQNVILTIWMIWWVLRKPLWLFAVAKYHNIGILPELTTYFLLSETNLLLMVKIPKLKVSQLR